METVGILFSPVEKKSGFKVNLNFDFSKQKLYELDHRSRDWDLQLMDGRRTMGRAVFRAYQFIAEGIERRTVVLTYLELRPQYRGHGNSTAVLNFVLETVTTECDEVWGKIFWKPVLFIEKRDLKYAAERDRNWIFDFLRKIGEQVLGLPNRDIPQEGEIAVIGEDVSLELIQEHFFRSTPSRFRL